MCVRVLHHIMRTFARVYVHGRVSDQACMVNDTIKAVARQHFLASDMRVCNRSAQIPHAHAHAHLVLREVGPIKLRRQGIIKLSLKLLPPACLPALLPAEAWSLRALRRL
jgi:hypothetical protein